MTLTRRTSEHIVFDGQSFNNVPVPTIPMKVMALLKPKSFAVVGINGTPYSTRAAIVPNLSDQHLVNGFAQILVDISFQSDIMNGLTAAQALAAAETYHDARRAKGFDKTVICTMPPVQQTTAIWGTYNASMETQRLALNPLILASTHFDAKADIASIPQLADPSNTTYFSDGLHPATAGANLIAPVIVAALASVGVT